MQMYRYQYTKFPVHVHVFTSFFAAIANFSITERAKPDPFKASSIIINIFLETKTSCLGGGGGRGLSVCSFLKNINELGPRQRKWPLFFLASPLRQGLSCATISDFLSRVLLLGFGKLLSIKKCHCRFVRGFYHELSK